MVYKTIQWYITRKSIEQYNRKPASNRFIHYHVIYACRLIQKPPPCIHLLLATIFSSLTSHYVCQSPSACSRLPRLCLHMHVTTTVFQLPAKNMIYKVVHRNATKAGSKILRDRATTLYNNISKRNVCITESILIKNSKPKLNAQDEGKIRVMKVFKETKSLT